MFASETSGRGAAPPVRSALTGSGGRLGIAFMLAFACGACIAGLGQGVDSVERDHAALGGTSLTRTSMGGYDIHAITMGDGTQVREYASPAGAIFATGWSGRSLPDLKVVLGPHYFRFASQLQGNATRAKALSLNADGLVVDIAKLPRGFLGSAQLTRELPAGVKADALR